MAIYAAVAFFIFFLFFIFITVHTLRLNKNETDELSRIPLDDLKLNEKED